MHIGVLVRWNLQTNALVHAVAGHLVHDVALYFQDRKVPRIRDGYGFGQAFIVTRALCDIKVGCWNLRVQALHDWVAASDHLRGFLLVASGVAALALQLCLVLSVINAVFGLWRRALTFEPLAALAAGALHSTLLVCFTRACAAAAVSTCHSVFLLKGGLIQRPLGAFSRISNSNSSFSETIADFISNSPVLFCTSLSATRKFSLNQNIQRLQSRGFIRFTGSPLITQWVET